ncbi:MAG TPA: chorismate mutase [Blastocatellia bacterium]|nr:chorismate mutase [Blastocatellia bacterium]
MNIIRFTAFLFQWESKMKLHECRDAIDSIDVQLLGLLNRRAAIVKEIGLLKRQAGIPVADHQREIYVTQRIIEQNPGDLCDEAAIRIFRVILEESRTIQRDIFAATKIAEAA